MNLIRVVSDLHLEFSNGHMELPISLNETETILVLAGDIGIAHKPATYLTFLGEMDNRFKCVIYILGNHESYSGKFTQTLGKIRENIKDLTHVHVLEKETLVIDDIAFVCATLWTDFDRGDPMSILYAQQSMNDFKIIRIGPTGEPWRRKFSPNDAYADFLQAKTFIFEEVVKHKEANNKVVVVTHHAPSHKSGDPKYKDSRISGAYASNMDDMIIDTKPDLWIHGHMHNESDYIIGDTRIICNPRGYYKYDENQQFDPLLVVDI